MLVSLRNWCNQERRGISAKQTFPATITCGRPQGCSSPCRCAALPIPVPRPHPSFVCRPGLGQDQMERGCKEGWGTVPWSSRMGIREFKGSSADRSQTMHQGLAAHLRLRLSETKGPHAKPVSHFLSRPRGSRGLGQHHPGHFPAPLFLTQRNPVQEGNVCISIQMLVVWTFPFTA